MPVERKDDTGTQLWGKYTYSKARTMHDPRAEGALGQRPREMLMIYLSVPTSA